MLLSMKASKAESPSFFWADLIRVVAICLVVLVHSFSLTFSEKWDHQLSLFFFVLAKNCVPLFVMLSGALLLTKLDNFNHYWVKRIKRVVLPWLGWTLLFTLLLSPVLVTQPGAFLSELRANASSFFPYIPLIICLYALIPALKIFTQYAPSTYRWYVVGLWFVGISLLPYLRNSLAFPLSVDNGLVRQTVEYSGYLTLGFIWIRVQLRLSALWIAMLFLIVSSMTFMLSSISADTARIYTAYISPGTVVSSSLLFWWLKQLDCGSGIFAKSVKTLSQASFGVFLIHSFLLQQLRTTSFFINDGSLLANVQLFGVTLILSFVISMVVSSISKKVTSL